MSSKKLQLRGINLYLQWGGIWVIRPRAARWAAAGFTWLGVWTELWQTSIASVLQGTSALCAMLTAPGPVNSSGHYVYRRFNIQQFHVLPTQCVYVFCVNLRTAIISLYNINWLVCITETECVYCAVCSEIHTEYINTLCGQNLELMNVKLVVHIVTNGIWRVKSRL